MSDNEMYQAEIECLRSGLPFLFFHRLLTEMSFQELCLYREVHFEYLSPVGICLKMRTRQEIQPLRFSSSCISLKSQVGLTQGVVSGYSHERRDRRYTMDMSRWIVLSQRLDTDQFELVRDRGGEQTPD